MTAPPGKCSFCGVLDSALHSATSSSAAAAASSPSSFNCPAKAGIDPLPGGHPLHNFVPIPVIQQVGAAPAPASAASPVAPGIVQVTHHRVEYDPTVRLTKPQVTKIIAALKADRDKVPKSKEQERDDLLCFFELLEDLTSVADHAHFAGSTGHILEFQNIAVRMLRLHLVPGSSDRQVSREQCLATISEVIPLPSPPPTPSPAPRTPQPARPSPTAPDQQHRGRRSRGGGGSGGGGGGGGGGNGRYHAPAAASIAPSLSRSYSSTASARGGGSGNQRR